MVPPLEHTRGVHGLTETLTHSTQKSLPTIIKLDAMTAWRCGPNEFIKLSFPSLFLGRVAQLVWWVVRVIVVFLTNIGHFGILFIFIKKRLSFFILFHRSWLRMHMIVLLLFQIDEFFLCLSRQRLQMLHSSDNHGVRGLGSHGRYFIKLELPLLQGQHHIHHFGTWVSLYKASTTSPLINSLLLSSKYRLGNPYYMLLFPISWRLSLSVALSYLKNDRWSLSSIDFLLHRMVTIVCRFFLISSYRHSRCKIGRMLCIIDHFWLGIPKMLLPSAKLGIQVSIHVIMLASLLQNHFSERYLDYWTCREKIVLGCLFSRECFPLNLWLFFFFIKSSRFLIEIRIRLVVLMRRGWHRKRCKLILGTSCKVLIVTVKGLVTTSHRMCHHWEDGSKTVIRIVYGGPACYWNSVLNHHGMWRDRERWERGTYVRHWHLWRRKVVPRF